MEDILEIFFKENTINIADKNSLQIAEEISRFLINVI